MQSPPAPVALNCSASPVNVSDGKRKKKLLKWDLYIWQNSNREEDTGNIYTHW